MFNMSSVLGLAVMLAGCAGVAEPLPPDGQPPGARRTGGKATPESMRMRIAAAIEGHTAFRTLLDGGAPRLLDAKIAGPLQGPYYKGQYCVSIRFETFSLTRSAIVSEQASPDGGSVLNVGPHMPEGGIFGQANAPPPECTNGWRPFPELQQLRNKRRAAQGLPI